MSLISELLTEMGWSQEQIAPFEADEAPEGFDHIGTFREWYKTQEESIIEQKKQSIIDAYKEEFTPKQYAATVKPIISLLKKTGGFTDEEMEAYKPKEGAMIDPKLAIIGLAKKIEEKVKIERGSTDDERKAKYAEMEQNYADALEKIKELNLKLVQEVEDASKSADARVNSFKTAHVLETIYRDKKRVQFDDDDKIAFYAKSLTPYILDNFNVNLETLEVSSKDGGKAWKPDKKSYFKDVYEVVNHYKEENNIGKKSNQDPPPGGGQGGIVVNGKPLDTSGAAFLRKKIGG